MLDWKHIKSLSPPPGGGKDDAPVFRKNYSEPGPGVDPNAPESTGLTRLFEILELHCGRLVKLNLLFIISCLPIITLPPALFAMNQLVLRMLGREPVDCFYDYRLAFKKYWKQGYAAFAAGILPMLLSAGGALFYLNRVALSFLFFLPFMLCTTVFLSCLLSMVYLYAFLGAGFELRRALLPALSLGLGRPGRSLPAALLGWGLALGGILTFPVSGIYLLLIGFAFPCLLGNFLVRTLIAQYLGSSSL